MFGVMSDGRSLTQHRGERKPKLCCLKSAKIILMAHSHCPFSRYTIYMHVNDEIMDM
jgi:hypothetical protein